MSKIRVPAPTELENRVHQKLDAIGVNIDTIRDVIQLIDLWDYEEKKERRKQKLREIYNKITLRVVVKRAIYSYVLLDYILNRVLDYYLIRLISILP